MGSDSSVVVGVVAVPVPEDPERGTRSLLRVFAASSLLTELGAAMLSTVLKVYSVLA